MTQIEPDPFASHPAADAHLLAEILQAVCDKTGTDFSRYRTATIRRRVFNRMLSARATTLEDYLGLVLSREDEAQRLLERLTIKVSRFYRNSLTFDMLRRELIPELARRRRVLRIWCAGCGCGEEAYTFAMLLHEAGVEGFIEATDLDPKALAAARNGHYPAESLTELPPDLMARYLEPLRQGAHVGFAVGAPVRSLVRFTRHDLTAASPIPQPGKFDIVSCRNVLIYFRRDAQEHVFERLTEALSPGALLCLGEAEWPPPAFAESLLPLPRKARIFRSPEPALASMT